jgi:hypothetical protein
VSTRKNPGVVDDAVADVDGSAEAAEVSEPALGHGLDPDLDQVPVEDLESGELNDAEASEDRKPTKAGSKKRLKIVIGGTALVVVAAVAVVVAGALGGSAEGGIPENVSDPSVVVTALNDGGIACNGSAVSGEVATCNATVAVRVFDSTAKAEAYVSALVKDPLTSSAIGWVRHGNVVVASPLTTTPEIAAALGTGSQIY